MKHPELSPYAGFGPQGARYGNDEFFLKDTALRAERTALPRLDGSLSWRPHGDELLHEVKQLAREY
jgi:hypothetical protein